MVQFNLLTGKQAGARWVARRFPVRIGRSAECDLRVEDDGVWSEHLQLQFERRQGFLLQTEPGALAQVNGHPFEGGVLRNGDIIEIGALKLQFWLAETRQAGLAWREWLVWIITLLISVAQIVLIYLLLSI